MLQIPLDTTQQHEELRLVVPFVFPPEILLVYAESKIHYQGMSTIDARETLDRMIRSNGETYAGLSRMLGRNSAYVQQFITRPAGAA